MILPPLIKMPCRVARPKPTITAVGVAKPMAQGQAITKTAMAFNMACGAGKLKAKNPKTKVKMATAKTAGTKTALILSANRCILGWSFWAFRTNSIILDNAVCPPTRGFNPDTARF